MRIRPATPADLQGINEIYNHYVLNAFSTFDTVPCSIEDRRAWFGKYQPPYHLLVADENNAVIGWACVSPYRDHAVVAGIALPNEGSVKLHHRFGLREIGVFREYARKNGRSISSVWMQRVLSDA